MRHRRYTPYVGVVFGGIAGVALPAYIGWEIGDCAQKYLELTNSITALKITSSAVLTGLIYNLTVPLGIFMGIATEKIFRSTFNGIKNSLENLLISNNHQ